MSVPDRLALLALATSIGWGAAAFKLHDLAPATTSAQHHCRAYFAPVLQYQLEWKLDEEIPLLWPLSGYEEKWVRCQ
jgi:hypothetical protein